MKRRCVPLRADHNLLTPGTHTQSGVKLQPCVQVWSDVVTSSHLSDASRSESAVGLTRRRSPAASPTRRLRFEDETETEVETRYRERQRRRAPPHGTSVLVSKPQLRLYVKDRMGEEQQEAGHVVDGHIWPSGTDHCTSCKRVSGGGFSLNIHHPPNVLKDRGRTLNRPHLHVRSEPIRETYIGCVTLSEINRGQVGGEHPASNQGRRKNQVQHYGNQANSLLATPTTDLPINPYANNQQNTSVQPPSFDPPTSKCPHSPSVMMSQSISLDSTKVGNNTTQQQAELQKPAAAHQEKKRSPLVVGGSVDFRERSSTSETTDGKQTLPTPERSSNGQDRQPMRTELHSDNTSAPKHVFTREEPSRLSLRRLFSNVRLSRTRSSSLDRLGSRPAPPTPEPTSSCNRKSLGLLKKSPSVQSLSAQGAPLLQLKKSLSVQNFGLEQRKDRSADYRPAAEQSLQRCLGLEDVGSPCSARSVGRVLQVCSDGSFLLEVSRPKSKTYGFIISRGRGRPDSGVYVEDMVDSSTEKLFTGLLEVGDEILEVNGEKVSSLSLDQVTHLLTNNARATVRVLRHWRPSPR